MPTFQGHFKSSAQALTDAHTHTHTHTHTHIPGEVDRVESALRRAREDVLRRLVTISTEFGTYERSYQYVAPSPFLLLTLDFIE